ITDFAPLSLHGALPIYPWGAASLRAVSRAYPRPGSRRAGCCRRPKEISLCSRATKRSRQEEKSTAAEKLIIDRLPGMLWPGSRRSEEHTSELQSLAYLV